MEYSLIGIIAKRSNQSILRKRIFSKFKPNKDDKNPQTITITRARCIVIILYNGQHIQKYRSKAIVVISKVE